MPKAKDVAEWLLDEIHLNEGLSQKAAVRGIAEQFGVEFLYQNKNGNTSIAEAVLDEFQQMKDENVHWNKGQRCWQLLEKTRAVSLPGRLPAQPKQAGR